VSRGRTVCCFPFKCMCRGGILFVDLRSCVSVEGGIMFVVLLSCVSVEGHTVCCFPFKCKCRGAYCLLLSF